MQNCQNQTAPAQVQPHSVCWSFNKIRPKYDLMSDAVWHKAPSVLATLAQVSEGYCLKKHQPCLSHVRFTSPSRFIICIIDIKKTNKQKTTDIITKDTGCFLFLVLLITSIYGIIYNWITLKKLHTRYAETAPFTLKNGYQCKKQVTTITINKQL